MNCFVCSIEEILDICNSIEFHDHNNQNLQFMLGIFWNSEDALLFSKLIDKYVFQNHIALNSRKVLLMIRQMYWVNQR